MNRKDTPAINGLRRAFAHVPEPVPRGQDCPDPERLWAAATGELPAIERRAVVDHLTGCPECTELWRLAWAVRTEMLEAQGELERTRRSLAPVVSGPWRRRRGTLAAAAALAALAVGGVGLWHGGFIMPAGPTVETQDLGTWKGSGGLATLPRTQGPDPGPVLRSSGSHEEISSLVETPSLPRDRFLLRWTPGPRGTRYELTLSDPDQSLFLVKPELTEPEFLVPKSDLSSLQPGTEISWRVTASLPDGTEISANSNFSTVVR